MKLWEENAKDLQLCWTLFQPALFQQISKEKGISVKNEVKTVLFKEIFLNKLDICPSLESHDISSYI